MQSKIYIWIIVAIAVLTGVVFLVMSGVFDNKEEQLGIFSHTGKKTVEKSKKDYRQKIEEMDLTEQGLDFEFDVEEMKDDMDDVSGFDEVLDVSGIDAEVY